MWLALLGLVWVVLDCAGPEATAMVSAPRYAVTARKAQTEPEPSRTPDDTYDRREH